MYSFAFILNLMDAVGWPEPIGHQIVDMKWLNNSMFDVMHISGIDYCKELINDFVHEQIKGNQNDPKTLAG
jgi:hypothetical protein